MIPSTTGTRRTADSATGVRKRRVSDWCLAPKRQGAARVSDVDFYTDAPEPTHSHLDGRTVYLR